MLVNRGVDQWFSDNVQSAVRNGATIGEAYRDDVSAQMDGDILVVAEQLSDVRPLFDNRVQFSNALMQVGRSSATPPFIFWVPTVRCWPAANRLEPLPMSRHRWRRLRRRRWRALPQHKK